MIINQYNESGSFDPPFGFTLIFNSLRNLIEDKITYVYENAHNSYEHHHEEKNIPAYDDAHYNNHSIITRKPYTKSAFQL